jgi:hypothetical protein
MYHHIPNVGGSLLRPRKLVITSLNALIGGRSWLASVIPPSRLENIPAGATIFFS